MWGIIDIIILVFILLSAIGGYRKGLISLGIHLFAFVLALLISFVLYRPIGNIIINTTQVDETIQATIQKNAETMVNTKGFENDLTKSLVESAENGMLPEVSKELAYNIVYLGTMIVLFLVLRVCLMLVNTVANAISKLPVLDQVNKLGGAAYGVVRGIIITYAVLLIISLGIAINPTTKLAQMIDDTYLAKTMMENNILNVFFVKN
ncbi:MAG: CvpA family protein [Clostridiales bacterium]|nr:CvpA family protein [Clostridiales bacterium]MBD9159423.1 CvpA family protein [Clostridiales bacterium]